MKRGARAAADESATCGVSVSPVDACTHKIDPQKTSTKLRDYLSKKSGICSAPPEPKSQSSNGATRNVNNA